MSTISFRRHALAATGLTGIMFALACSGTMNHPAPDLAAPVSTPATTKVWVTGDLHNHTYLTDGSHTETEVFQNALDTFGLDWIANSEHGGAYGRDLDGTTWSTLLPLGDTANSSNTRTRSDTSMWRWQSLRDFSWPLLFGGTDGAGAVHAGLQASYPSKVIIQGVEWNVPSHEHGSVGIVGVSSGKAVADFEYMFDGSEKDRSRDSGIRTTYNTAAGTTPITASNPTEVDLFGNALSVKRSTHADAVAAIAYLQKNFNTTAYFAMNHPSRKLAYNVEHIRDFINAGPGVVVGLEGFPGHQREAYRGGYSSGPYYWNATTRTVSTSSSNGTDVTYKARTYGGADYMLAKTGGVMDALWGEGRRFWVFVNSDFHYYADGADFWPGQYAKTYLKAAAKTPKEVVAAMKTGSTYIVHGDLINALDFNASTGNGITGDDTSLIKTMGEELTVSSGGNVKITVRFKSPAANNNSEAPVVDHVDIIAGEVSPKAEAGTTAYFLDTNSTTQVLVRLMSSEFKTGSDGYQYATFTLSNVTKSMYFRLRGTNQTLAGGRLDTTTGDPLMDEVDTVSGTNTTAKAWADLWFYTNPIFIKVN